MAQQRASPPQRNHLPRIREFLEWMRDHELKARTALATKEIATFVPIDDARTFLAEGDPTRLAVILDELFFPQDPPVDDHTILKSYVAVFCILLDMNNAVYIQDFMSHGLIDQKLPFDPRHDPPPGFPPETAASNFYGTFCNTQRRFYVPIFEKNMARVYPVNQILPIASIDKIADGGSGSVISAIRLHSSYNQLTGHASQDLNDPLSETFTLKSYLSPDSSQIVECEVEAFRQLQRHVNPNIIGFYGNYSQGNSHNIILEYADQGNLDQYFERTEPPCEKDDIVSFWSGLFGIIKALDGIHMSEPRPIPGPDGKSIVINGWHQDVKPANILVLSNKQSSPYKYLFKLADLGLSHFKITTGEERVGVDDDTCGTQTYAAPECFRDNRFWDESRLPVKQSVDMFSYGCILSEAAVWVGKGRQGLRNYRHSRAMANKSNPRLGDRFHDGRNILPTVFECHQSVMDVLRVSDFTTRKVLRMIEKHLLLQNPDGRLDAKQLLHRANDLIDGGTDPRRSEPPHGVGQSRLSHMLASPSNFTSRPRPLSATPKEQSHFYSSQANMRQNPDTFILSGPEVEEPASMSTFSESGRFSPRFEQSKFATNRPIEYRSRPVSSPGLSGEQSSVPISSSDGHTTGLALRKVPENTSVNGDHQLIQTAWASQGAANRTSPPRGFPRDSPGPSQRRQSTSAGYHRNADAADRHDTIAPIMDVDEDDRRRGPFAKSLVNKTQPTQTAWNPPEEEFGTYGQTQIPRPRPASTPSSSTAARNLDSVASKEINGRASVGHQNKTKDASSKRVNNQKLPVLLLGPALEWKRAKKARDSIRNTFKFKKPEVPRLNGEWLLSSRVGKRDHVFIIDDAGSMREHWDELCGLFDILAYLVKKSDEDGIDMYFTMDDKKRNGMHVTGLVEILKKRKNLLQGTSKIEGRLEHILGEYCRALTDERDLRRNRSYNPPADDVKPLSVYVFTNALWAKNSDPKVAIAKVVDKLTELGHPASKVGIQFISFGSDPVAIRRLEHYDKGLGLRMDIVDTTPSTHPNLWKMILGAIDPEYDESSDGEEEPSSHSPDG